MRQVETERATERQEETERHWEKQREETQTDKEK